jgi:hypothetical protein
MALKVMLHAKLCLLVIIFLDCMWKNEIVKAHCLDGEGDIARHGRASGTTREEWEGVKSLLPRDEILASLHPVNAAPMVATPHELYCYSRFLFGFLGTKASPLLKP